MIEIQTHLKTAGGRIYCRRCQGKSRRTKLQCGAPAESRSNWCRFHGSRATGPRTALGRQRIAIAKTFHGRETRAIRAHRSLVSAQLRLSAVLLGFGNQRDDYATTA